LPVWRKENLFHHWGSNTRTAQPVVSRFYTVYSSPC